MTSSNNRPGSRSVNVAQLRVGSTLVQSIYDERDVLLLAAGSEVTQVFLENLKRRGIKSVRMHSGRKVRNTRQEAALKDSNENAPSSHTRKKYKNNVTAFDGGKVCSLRNKATNMLDREICSAQHMGLPPQGPAFSDEFTNRGTERYDKQNIEEFAEKRSESISKMNDVFEEMVSGGDLNTEALCDVTDSTLEDLKNDPDLLACLGINPNNGEYPARHSTLTSMMAIAIGAQFKLDRKTLTELSIGCLIHDAGMLKLNSNVYDPDEEITDAAWNEITQHPVLVFEMIQDVNSIPRRSALIAYQMHERCNGMGYPRKLSGDQIHPLSKIAAIADAFVALCSPRSFRKALHPYKAMEVLLEATQEGYYDPTAMRALLNTVSLFPVGSFVSLSDGRIGRVIRANGAHFDRPVIEIWPSEEEPENPEILDLVEYPDLTVESPIAPLDEVNCNEEVLLEC